MSSRSQINRNSYSFRRQDLRSALHFEGRLIGQVNPIQYLNCLVCVKSFNRLKKLIPAYIRLSDNSRAFKYLTRRMGKRLAPMGGEPSSEQI